MYIKSSFHSIVFKKRNLYLALVNLIFMLSFFFIGPEKFEGFEWTIYYALLLLINYQGIRFNAYHPVFFFATLYSIYVIAYPIVVSFGLLENNGYLTESTRMHLLYLSSYFFGIHFLESFLWSDPDKHLKFDARNLANVFLFFFFGFSLLYLIYNGLADGSSKREIIANRSQIANALGAFIHLTNIIGMLLLIWNYLSKGKFEIFLVAILLFVNVLAIIYAIERAYITRFMIMLLMLYSLRKRIGAFILLMVPIAVLIFPLLKSQSFENYELEYVLYKEFKTSGRTLAYTIEYEHENGPGYGKYIFYELVNRLSLGLIKVPPEDNISQIIQDRIYRNAHTGLGFTQLGQWYADAKKYGIAFGGMLMGFIFSFLHLKSRKNLFWLCIYIGVYTCFATTIRYSSFAWYGTAIKTVILPLMILVILGNLIIQNRKSPIIRPDELGY